MSRTSNNAAGGEFATGFRCGPDAIRYAKTFLDRGMGYQAASRASGVNEITLREMLVRKPAKVVALDLVRLPAPAPAPRESTRAIRMPSDKNRQIVAAVARKHGLTLSDIFSDSRKGPINVARQEAMYEVRKNSDLSLKGLGRLFDRNHTTILNGLRKHAERLQARLPDLLMDLAA